MWHLDIHDHHVGGKGAHPGKGLSPVAQAFDLKLVRTQQVGEQFEVQLIILDDQNLFAHRFIFSIRPLGSAAAFA
jgi:hypothetical protein